MRASSSALSRALLALALCACGGLPARVAAQAAHELEMRAVPVEGIVFEDRDGDGRRDPGEPGVEGVAVSDQERVAVTDADGRFRLDARGYGLVFVSRPDGYRVRGPFWRARDAGPLEFALVPEPRVSSFAFVHASDTHLDSASLPRIRRLRERVDSLAPAFVLITGDLVRDALRVPEPVASGLYEMLDRELAAFSVPVYTVPGNHEIFGIERHRSLVPPDHPLYGKRMYRRHRGPDYYSFTYGGVHFLGLNTVDYEDLWYYGHVDEAQREWIARDVAAAPDAPLVTFGHIPFLTGAGTRRGYEPGGPGRTAIEVDGRERFRHSVQDHARVLAPIQERLEVALQGHIHLREVLEHRTAAGRQRLISAAAVVGPASEEAEAYGPVSGITLHRVVDGRVDDGTFLPLDPGG